VYYVRGGETGGVWQRGFRTGGGRWQRRERDAHGLVHEEVVPPGALVEREIGVRVRSANLRDVLQDARVVRRKSETVGARTPVQDPTVVEEAMRVVLAASDLDDPRILVLV
jgi:hypothetical protein